MPPYTIAELENKITKRKAEIRKSCKKARRSTAKTEAMVSNDPEIRSYESRIQELKESLSVSQSELVRKSGKRDNRDDPMTEHLNRINPNPNLAPKSSGAVWKQRSENLPYQPATGLFTPLGYNRAMHVIPGIGVAGKAQFAPMSWTQLPGLVGDLASYEAMKTRQKDEDGRAFLGRLQALNLQQLQQVSYPSQLGTLQAQQVQQAQVGLAFNAGGLLMPGPAVGGHLFQGLRQVSGRNVQAAAAIGSPAPLFQNLQGMRVPAGRNNASGPLANQAGGQLGKPAGLAKIKASKQKKSSRNGGV